MAAHPIAPSTTDPVVEVLVAAMDQTDQVLWAEARRFELAAEWAALHPGHEVETSVEWAMRELELAGEGAPTVEESSVAEFAIAVGMTHDQGLAFVGAAVEIRHRLPRLWARVVAAEVPVWKARRVADSTRALPMVAAAFVDRQIAHVLHGCSFAQIDRTVETARDRFDPAETERRREAAYEQRHFTIRFDQMLGNGLVHVDAVMDLTDAYALDQTLTARAATLDPQLPLDVRRSMAAGLLDPDGDQARSGKEVVVYTHVRPDQALVEVENTHTVVTPEQVREWCQSAGTRVTVRPVLDLDVERSTSVHDPTPILREQVQAMFPTCVFPHCNRSSRSCDLDHRIPWPQGPTTTSNLYPLCRRHHRLKTTGGWSYLQTDPATIDWTSPLGLTHRRHIR